MASENEPAKLLLPYLQRADELQKHDSLVSYYCRLYAMERGLKIPQHERTKMTNSLLVSLIFKLEKDKMSVKFGTDDHLHLEGFALNVFGKADKQDRAGRSDLNTAKTFYAASIFFEILNQFGELSPDLVQKQKYAAWKAADIRKALKEGRKPVPGPHGGERNLSKSSSFASDAVDLEPRHSRCDTNRGPKLSPSPPAFHDPIQQQPSAKVASSPPSYPSADYPCHDHQSPRPISRSDSCTYSQTYHQRCPEEHRPQQLVPQNYPSQEVPPSFSYQNLQSYSKFSEGSLSAASTHCLSNYQLADASYSHKSVPHVTNYSPPSQYNSNCGNGSVSDSAPSALAYHYDSNYWPPPEKIAEAHKEARLAVGALAFDDVSVAVKHLRKSLQLLTNPSAGLGSGFANLRCIIWLVDYERATYSKSVSRSQMIHPLEIL